jgi:acetyltransferase-like isoleucine patch superfamily enzyme
MFHKLKTIIIILGILLKNIFHLPKILYFNFHYLPFKQAIKLPIFVYNVKLRNCTGKLKIESDNISFRMIEIGRDISKTYPDTGVIWDHKGTIVFKGTCKIGISSTVMVGEQGYLEFGDNFMNTTSAKIIAFHYVKFHNNIRLGWDAIVMDTAHHVLKNLKGEFTGKGYGPIIIGENNWISTRSMIMAGAKTPDYCIIAANSYLNKDFSTKESKILLAGSPVTIKAKGIWRDFKDDSISNYETYKDVF